MKKYPEYIEVDSKKYKINIEQKDIKNIMGMTEGQIINYFFRSNKDIGNKFISECQKEENLYLEKNGGRLYNNTLTTLKKLINLNYELYIVSNCQKGYIEAFLNYYEIYDLFNDFECSGRTGKNKEYNINLVLKRNNIKEAVYVGDTYMDYVSAKNNRINFIWARYGFGNIEEKVNYIDDISELISKKINNEIIFSNNAEEFVERKAKR